jgi:MFS family permease
MGDILEENINGSYNHTIYACFIGYITQAILNNFAPLLFLTFQRDLGITLNKISFLISLNFGVQLAVDFLAAKYTERIGYRKLVVAAHIFAAIGLAGLAAFSFLPVGAFMGLLASTVFYAIGGGLIEVLVSPIMEACPTKRKAASMSLLHSFYCWGQAGVILVSTLFFALLGKDSWRLLALIWMLIPLANAVYFFNVPIRTLEEDNDCKQKSQIAKSGLFWLMALLMLCSGASEMSISQWASSFAEEGLGISKTMGDLAGPCVFALLMGTSRLLYAKSSERINLTKYMTGSAILCFIGYLLASLAPWPALNLAGCALCGFSAGIMWPGTFSIAAKRLNGGASMFALLALFGDFGCGSGPALVGLIADWFGGDMKKGILAVAVVPAIMLAGLAALKHKRAEKLSMG